MWTLHDLSVWLFFSSFLFLSYISLNPHYRNVYFFFPSLFRSLSRISEHFLGTPAVGWSAFSMSQQCAYFAQDCQIKVVFWWTWFKYSEFLTDLLLFVMVFKLIRKVALSFKPSLFLMWRKIEWYNCWVSASFSK